MLVFMPLAVAHGHCKFLFEPCTMCGYPITEIGRMREQAAAFSRTAGVIVSAESGKH